MPLSDNLRREAQEKPRAGKVGRNGRGGRAEWIDRIDCIHFLENMEVMNVSHATSDELLFSCPFPGHSSGDARPSAYMNTGENDKGRTSVWKCHGCGRSGNAITFYAEMQHVSATQAMKDLREEYAPDFRQPRGGSISNEFAMWMKEREARHAEHEEPLPHIPWETYNERYSVDWPDAYMTWDGMGRPDDVNGYLFNRGFEPETLMDWNIGWDDRTERFTIPVCDEEGNLVGIKARTWKTKREEKIKYLILGDRDGKKKRYGWKHYEKSRVLFGLHMVSEDEKTVVLVEGELDALALYQVGVASVCTGGAALSEVQAKLLRQFDEVIVMFDGDEAGWGATAEVCTQMEQFVRVRVVEEDHDEDPAAMVNAGKTAALMHLLDDATPSYMLTL